MNFDGKCHEINLKVINPHFAIYQLIYLIIHHFKINRLMHISVPQLFINNISILFSTCHANNLKDINLHFDVYQKNFQTYFEYKNYGNCFKKGELICVRSGEFCSFSSNFS